MTHLVTINRKSVKRAGGRFLSEDPLVCVVDDFLTPDECAHFRQLGEGRLKRAKVAGGPTADVSDVRTNFNCWIEHRETLKTRTVSSKIAKLLGMPREHAEKFQLIHYPVSTEYQPHMDTFDPFRDEGKPYFARGGQRLVTALAYLNDVEDGGATEFVEMDLQVAAKAGRLLIFYNCGEGTTTPHPKARHAGTPVLQGEKWAFNLWFREAPVTQTIVPSRGANTFTGTKTTTVGGVLMQNQGSSKRQR